MTSEPGVLSQALGIAAFIAVVAAAGWGTYQAERYRERRSRRRDRIAELRRRRQGERTFPYSGDRW